MAAQRRLAIALFALTLVNSAAALGRLQSAGAIGQLTCNGKPYKDAKVRLYEQDITDPDDLMGEEVLSDKDGHFHVQGSESELGGITVKLFIGHDCNDEKKECKRVVVIYLPDEHIYDGGIEKIKKPFDAGILNLDAHLPGEGRACVN